MALLVTIAIARKIVIIVINYSFKINLNYYLYKDGDKCLLSQVKEIPAHFYLMHNIS
jgi:hypothetical protein